MVTKTVPGAPAAAPGVPRMPLPDAGPGGLNEMDAGVAIADYIGRVGGDDIDVFDESNLREQEESAPAASPPSSSDSEEERVAAARDDSTGTPGAVDEEDGEAPAADSEEAEGVSGEEQSSDEADADTEVLEGATLAAALGVEEDSFTVDDDGNVLFRYRVDGESGTATLDELVRGYQREAHTNRKSEQLSEERRALREQTQQREQELAQAIQQAGAVGQVMKDRVLARYQGVDWDKLQGENPGQAALMYQQLQQELATIDHEVANLQATAADQVQKQQLVMQEMQREWVTEQQRKLVEHLPVMGDAEARKPVLQEYQDYLLDYGFSMDEVRNILDHRYLRVIDDAVQHRRAVKAKGGKDAQEAIARKKLVKVPKVLKPGAPRGEEQRAQDRRRGSLKRLRESGTDDDAARFAVESGVVDSLL